MLENPNEEHKIPNETIPNVQSPAAQPDPDADFEAFYSEILKEFGPQTSSHQPRKTTSGQTVNTQAAAAVKNSKKRTSKKKKKKKGVKGLVITLCLELAGIAGIILWWIFRIL